MLVGSSWTENKISGIKLWLVEGEIVATWNAVEKSNLGIFAMIDGYSMPLMDLSSSNVTY